MGKEYLKKLDSLSLTVDHLMHCILIQSMLQSYLSSKNNSFQSENSWQGVTKLLWFLTIQSHSSQKFYLDIRPPELRQHSCLLVA